MATAKKSTKSRTTPTPKDAVAMLKADHKKVSELFEAFENSRSASKKKALVAEICMELTVHTQLEEEIFYPAVKAALRDKELVPEAAVEHASVKALISQVQDAEPGGEEYEAKVKVMSEYVKGRSDVAAALRSMECALDMAALAARPCPCTDRNARLPNPFEVHAARTAQALALGDIEISLAAIMEWDGQA